MPTIEEIRTEWKGVRSAVGMLIGYIDGKVAQLQNMSEAYRKGYNDGVVKAKAEAEEGRSEVFQTAYEKGLEQAWEVALRLRDYDLMVAVFGEHGNMLRVSPQEAIQKLKEYDAIMHQVTHSNAQKFVEVFGFAPGYEILDDGIEVYPSLNDEFWNAEYKEPEAYDDDC